jgi:ketosteroid isomerase-like protein
MSRRALPLLALAFAACGGEQPSDEQQVRTAITDLANAEADGDYERVCELMTDELAALVVSTDPKGAQDCETALKNAGGNLTAAERKKLRAVKVTRVELRGEDTALADVEPNDQFGANQPLRKVDGQWKLDRNGG